MGPDIFRTVRCIGLSIAGINESDVVYIAIAIGIILGEMVNEK